MASKTTSKTDDVELSDLKREVDHQLNDAMSEDSMLATPSEREENRIQMAEIKRRTVEPKLMLLNVKRVVSAENSQKWAIDIEHPIMEDDDHIRVFVDKPVEGWTRDYKLVRMMDWYGIQDQNPHRLEFHDLYLKKDEENSDYAHGWRLVEPPDYDPPIPVQLRRYWQDISVQFFPKRSNARMWLVLLGGIIASTMAAPIVLGLIGQSVPLVAVVILGYVLATILGMALMSPDGGDDS